MMVQMLPHLIAFFIYALTLVNAQETTGDHYFVNPPPSGAVHDYSNNLNFTNGSTVQLQWSSNWTSNTLIMFQNGNDNYSTIVEEKGAGMQTYSWTVGFDASLLNASLPNIYFYRMTNEDNSDEFFSSHYFNIIEADKPPAPNNTLPSNNSSANPTNASPQDAGSTGLSSGAKAGIGVGAAAGVIVILTLLGGLIWYRKKASRVHHQENGAINGGGFPADKKTMSSGNSGVNSDILPGYYAPPAEMENTQSRAEIGGEVVAKELPQRRPTIPQEMP